MPRILVAFIFFISVLIAANSPAQSALAATCGPDSAIEMGSVHSAKLQCVDLQNCCSQSCSSDSQTSLNSISTTPVSAPKNIDSTYSFSLVTGFDDVVKRPPKSLFLCA